ncbi:MAG TPA: ABC transporter permease subunit, partial [Candidatus Limnocylindria bacterium]|nr:ABC transporter permease subunit [Candidatus Limnocylindria bacterium]
MSRRDPWSAAGLLAFFALLFVAVFGERIAPHETIYFVVEHGRDPRPYEPGLVFPFGSDVLGRDLFSLVLAGARTTLVVVIVGGLARVGVAAILAMLVAVSRRARAVVDAASELAAAVPATLIVLLIVLVFVRGETTFLVFIGAVLLTGWAGTYRVLRAELDRLRGMAFTDSAAAIGARRSRILLRHHLPHLTPMLSVSAGQQSIASLVALAELGVLGVFVGTTRNISIEESLSFVPAGQRNRALIADPPEWGGLLANARGTESLWATRWEFLVPGVAFALLAVALAAIGAALARRYARRDILPDLRGRGAAVLAVVTALLILLTAAVPERYASAREWAADARAALADAGGDLPDAFADAGLEPVGGGYTVERTATRVVQTAPASVRVGGAEVRESADGPLDATPVLFRDSGGGTVRAPLVFASWGLSAADHRPAPILGVPDLGAIIADWPDDYATVDVRGKVVVVLRAMRIATGTRTTNGPDVESSIQNALKRGPAAVIYVDPQLPSVARGVSPSGASPYDRLRALGPVPLSAAGPPVMAMSVTAADRLLASVGIRPSEIYGALRSEAIPSDSTYAKRSAARDLDVMAEVVVPASAQEARVRSVVAAVPSTTPGAAHVVVWGVLVPGSTAPSSDVLVALARSLAHRSVPVILVGFDPSVDPARNARAVADRLDGRRVGMVIVLDDLTGPALRFRSPNGDLIP